MFYNSNTFERDRQLVSQILGVRYSNSLERYLGLSNMNTRYLSQEGNEAILTYSMDCFLLPKSLCGELESILARFWWQKGHGRQCEWNQLCELKENRGLGFRRLAKFNLTLLAKQGWRLINYPNSLLACVLKAKCYSNSDFLSARLRNIPSYTWKSVWASMGLLQDGLCWRVGTGAKISVLGDVWLPRVVNYKVGNNISNADVTMVSNLIDSWNPPMGMSVKINFNAAYDL
ncbi:reverse transcriptase-like protein [Gossypium australe]|uniref:Reverse transcriptase-like protein n=1 Tax=Gossypium australe TaxID=47621 RepID=A0A5B6VPE7_9ROSI|nr:reverse transcriptase-like protein [Gossypium australe]